MTVWLILLGVLLLALLLAQLRVGGRAEYTADGFAAWLRVGAWHKQIFPTEEKPKKRVKRKKQASKPSKAEGKKPEQEKRGGKLAQLRTFLPLLLEAVGALQRKLRVERLVLRLTWASDDPASTALGYGAANAAMGALYPLLEQTFTIKKSEIDIALDFQAHEPELYACAAFSLTLGQLLTLTLRYGAKAIEVGRAERRTDGEPSTKRNEVTVDE